MHIDMKTHWCTVFAKGMRVEYCIEACEGRDGHRPFVRKRVLSVSGSTLTTGETYVQQFRPGEVKIVRSR